MKNFLDTIKEPLVGMLYYIPLAIQVILVLIIGWLIARSIRKLTKKVLKKSNWDEKLLNNAIGGDTNVFLSKLIYYLIMIIVLMIALEMMGVSEVLDPLKEMTKKVFNFIPNVVAAGILGFIGYLLATFISNLISFSGNLLDNIIEKTGFKDTDKVVNILKQVAFIVVFIPFVIFSLNALQLEAISNPANAVLSDILTYIPNLIAATIVIGLFIMGGKFLTDLLFNLLQSLGVDSLASKIELDNALGKEQSLSNIISKIAFFFLAFFGIISGIEILDLQQLTIILNNILHISGMILFGVIVLILGNYISKLVSNMMKKGEGNSFMVSVVRFATMGLFIAMSLRVMNIAPDIVNLAFGLTIGCIAVVIALAYGLGGREAAGEHFKEIISKIKGDKKL